MANDKTKHQIADSFRKLMDVKPFNKITIADIAEGCQISRMTFYYHFEDIYSLLRWVLEDSFKAAVEADESTETWQQMLHGFLIAAKQNQNVLLNAIHSLGRGEISVLFKEMAQSKMSHYVQEMAKGMPVQDEDLEFISRFYKHAFVGVVLDWIDSDMKESSEIVQTNLETLMNNNINDDVHDFVRARCRKEG